MNKMNLLAGINFGLVISDSKEATQAVKTAGIDAPVVELSDKEN